MDGINPRFPNSGRSDRSGDSFLSLGNASQQQQRKDEPTVTAQAVEYLADRALQIPPQDIAVLAATVQRFLLTDLEPAMRIAERIRDDVAGTVDRISLDFVAEDRQDQALALLFA